MVSIVAQVCIILVGLPLGNLLLHEGGMRGAVENATLQTTLSRQGRVFVGGTLTTLYLYTFSTTTVATAYYTCASAISTSTMCTGRRRRRAVNIRLRDASRLLPNLTDVDNLLAPSTKSPNVFVHAKNPTPTHTSGFTARVSSMGSMEQPRENALSGALTRQRLGFLTVTSFTSTTYTISTTTTDTATTVSLSIQCTLSGGSSVFPAC